MKSYQHIEHQVREVKHHTGYYDKTFVKHQITLETFLNNWRANYNYHDMENLQILIDFEEDVRNGIYTKTESNGTYVHFKLTEAGKEIIRFKEML